MLGANGAVRPHWQRFLSHLQGLSPEDMRRRMEFVNRRIQENGVTYNVYTEGADADRPWALDPLPLILPADEWRQLSAAVAQRATLLNRILGDLYGPRKLLSEGLLPPALVYGQRSYLQPCQGITPRGGNWLHLYAVDLARAPDGKWWVVADSTQAPSGAGYTLENRLIVSRVFPDLFNELRVQHLASFFHDLQDTLSGLAQLDPGEQPHIVLLTPGPYNETYFEHAYLARYLGYPLVEGQDLTVRGESVFLKTLQGLKRVHVILRRQDDDYCDPLELRSNSTLGVPGLLNVLRCGRVAMANALGSGILGSGALMGFLPAICQRLLGENLAIPSLATWWCGEQPAFDYVRANFANLVIKPAYPGQNFSPVIGDQCDAAQREEVLQRIAARPQAYVGQERMQMSHAPAWGRNQEPGLQASAIGLRLYAVATPQGYSIMPGGLSRIAGNPGNPAMSMQGSGSAKDTWVLADGPVNRFSLLKPRLTSSDLVRSSANLSSRVVENLFWLGRYSERVDASARLLRVALSRLDGGEATPAVNAAGAALSLAQYLHVIQSRNAWELEDILPPRQQLLQTLLTEEQVGSLAGSVRSLMWTSTQVRERLALDHWHALAQMQRELNAIQRRTPTFNEVLGFLDNVVLSASSLTGFAMDNMTRDPGWHFLSLGRHLERLDFLASAIAGFLQKPWAGSEHNLEWLLELTDSIITYRSRYSRAPELLPVMDLIVLDASNPHGVAFQMDALLFDLSGMSAEVQQVCPQLLDACEALKGFDLSRFALIDAESERSDVDCLALARKLQAAVSVARAISDRLAQHYFTHTSDIARQVWTS